MGEPGDPAEAVITAKLADDFARAAADPGLGAATARFGDTTATRLAALPGHPAYNKARGFAAGDADHLPAVTAFFTGAGIPPAVEVRAGDASAALGRRLAAAGFHAAGVGATLHARARPSPATTRDPGVAVRELAAGEDDSVYLDTLFTGYGLDARADGAARTMMAIEHRAPGLRRYLAYADGRPAAAAALYPAAGWCYFAGAATVPAARRRGCQSALIHRRLQDAAATAPDVVVTTAAGSPSEENLRRHGFDVRHTRTLWRLRDRPPA